ncbi:MAG: tetratricopeptide repeat protein [Gemmatimonadaceae bacterium]
MIKRSPAEHWEHVEPMLGALLAAPADERATLLDQLSAGDQSLRGELRSLIDAHGRAGDFLETSAAAFAASHMMDNHEASNSTQAPGMIVGRYRLLEEIGRGGMGAVWLAERADGQFDQRVALKLVKRGMDTDEILARFLRERQILARLVHPNIARLLDGGVSEDGRPYFAMEYVPGVSITVCCDRRRASVEERLRLFVAVCRAIEYAHRNLVVHRDLKPSNVVVGDEGQVKLLDFGIAKLLGDDEGGGHHTGGAGRLMTPEYASPEQVAGSRITTASDVYQLGALLYELLTGHRPNPGDRITPSDVSHPTPPLSLVRPSAAVRRTRRGMNADGDPESIDPMSAAADRATTPKRLRRRLRGDLDAIVLTAMRNEPEHRYPTADAIADDIERHLALEPIRFGSDSFSYRASKFVRRHRLRVASATLILLAVISGVSIYTVQVRKERELAQIEAAKSAQNAQLLGGFFESWDPETADRGTINSASVARDAVVRAESDLRNQPEMLASALSVLGDLLTSLHQNSAADSLLARALTMQERQHRGPNADLAATLFRRGRLQFMLGNYEGTIASLRRSRAIYFAAFGPRHPETLRAQRELAIRVREVGKLGEAETLLRDVMRSLEGSRSQNSPFGLETAAALGYTLFLQGRYDEAISILRTTLKRQRSVLGERYGPTLSTMRWLGSAIRDKGDFDEAERLYRDAIRIARQLYGEDHEHTIYGEHVLSMLLERTGELEEAEALTRLEIEAAVRIFSPEHPYVVLERVRLGGILLDRGNRSEAEALLRRGLERMRQIYSPDYADLADVLNRLAYIAVAREAADADKLYLEASAFDRGRRAGSPVFVTDGLHFLAWTQHRKGDLGGAEASYRGALALYRLQLPPGHSYYAAAATGLGAVVLDAGRPREAEQYLREGLAQWEGNPAPDSARIAEARALLIRVAGNR